MKQEIALIHESVIIEEGAKIAEDVLIGPFCYIGKDVTIQSGCSLAANVILKGKVNLHQGVKIFSFVTLGNENSEIEVGEKTHIREFAQIGSQEDENRTPKKIIIGANNFLMGYVQILSGVELGDYCILTNAVRMYENVKCEERVIVGGLSTIEANNTLGTGAMIGGASYVTHDIPPFTLVEGNHATLKGLNVIGLRRRLENKDDIEEIKAIYKKLLGENVNKELAKELADSHTNEYVKRFASFIAQSNM